MKNILITGGAGFIGSNLSLKLVEKGYKVTALDNLSKQIHGNSPKNDSPLFKSIIDKVNFIEGNVVNKEDLEKAISGQDAIIHLAAETGTGQSMYQIHHYAKVNIDATAMMLDILANTKQHSVKKVIIASSRSIYGEGKYLNSRNEAVYPKHRLDKNMQSGNFEVDYPGETKPLQLVATDEDSKIHPSSVYGITKQVQEQLIMTVCPTIGIAPVAFRYQNVYGPGQSLTNPYTGILSIFSTLIKNNKEINVFEDGLESRDFVYIDDVVDATILGLEKEEANNQIFNVGTGKAVTVLKVVKELQENYNSNVAIKISGNYRLGDIRHNYADLTKIKEILGFNPKISFKEGIKHFANWVITQEVHEDNYAESIAEMKEKGMFK
ncbi:NAD-dependent epimerase/dehydratase family protein [Pedobacter segetis]|nr:NAD-dependent epimerase/dehydratase family protein [Pedobacter segetis]